MKTKAVLKTDFDLPTFTRGKVRDVYDLDDKLLIVSTDRISAYDYILPTPITDKGRILNSLSLFWFSKTKEIVDNHIIAGNWREFPPELAGYKDQIEGRAMLVKKTKKINIECVVRGYLSGSGWKEYQNNGMVCGIALPQGLQESGRLPEPVFTPATKEEMGKHDENISQARMADLIGSELTDKLQEISIKVYCYAQKFAESKGIIIADTKMEFGLLGEKIILIDEVLTPDSSRFWDMSTYKPGRMQDSYDKQFVRNYLDSIKWDRQPPVPPLPEDIVEKTREKYLQAYEKITGKKLL
ncbi:MAG: phosphoribosylaminoimidazolesuccinocarboxamide synthase [bacterium]